jgi:hypothetical protein
VTIIPSTELSPPFFDLWAPSLIQVPIPSSSIHKIDHLHGIRSDSIAFYLAFDSRDRVEGHDGMAGVIELSISDAVLAKLMSIAQSRVERARILLGYREDPSFFAVARASELWDRIIRRFSGALSNRMDCPSITRSPGSGDHSARFRRSLVEFPLCRILFTDTIKPIQYVPHGRHDAPHA